MNYIKYTVKVDENVAKKFVGKIDELNEQLPSINGDNIESISVTPDDKTKLCSIRCIRKFDLDTWFDGADDEVKKKYAIASETIVQQSAGRSAIKQLLGISVKNAAQKRADNNAVAKMRAAGVSQDIIERFMSMGWDNK